MSTTEATETSLTSKSSGIIISKSLVDRVLALRKLNRLEQHSPTDAVTAVIELLAPKLHGLKPEQFPHAFYRMEGNRFAYRNASVRAYLERLGVPDLGGFINACLATAAGRSYTPVYARRLTNTDYVTILSKSVAVLPIATETAQAVTAEERIVELN